MGRGLPLSNIPDVVLQLQGPVLTVWLALQTAHRLIELPTHVPEAHAGLISLSARFGGSCKLRSERAQDRRRWIDPRLCRRPQRDHIRRLQLLLNRSSTVQLVLPMPFAVTRLPMRENWWPASRAAGAKPGLSLENPRAHRRKRGSAGRDAEGIRNEELKRKTGPDQVRLAKARKSLSWMPENPPLLMQSRWSPGLAISRR